MGQTLILLGLLGQLYAPPATPATPVIEAPRPGEVFVPPRSVQPRALDLLHGLSIYNNAPQTN